MNCEKCGMGVSMGSQTGNVWGGLDEEVDRCDCTHAGRHPGVEDGFATGDTGCRYRVN